MDNMIELSSALLKAANPDFKVDEALLQTINRNLKSLAGQVVWLKNENIEALRVMAIQSGTDFTLLDMFIMKYNLRLVSEAMWHCACMWS